MARLRVREVAEAQGLDMSKLSRMANVALSTVRAVWHDPEHDVSFSTLRKLANALGCSVRDLIENGDPKIEATGCATGHQPHATRTVYTACTASGTGRAWLCIVP